MSLLDPRPDFVSQDDFLHAALGLLAVSRRTLATAAKVVAAPGGAPDGDDEPDDLLYAALGAIALSVQVERALRAGAAGPHEPEAALPVPGGFDQIEDLLR